MAAEREAAAATAGTAATAVAMVATAATAAAMVATMWLVAAAVACRSGRTSPNVWRGQLCSTKSKDRRRGCGNSWQ